MRINTAKIELLMAQQGINFSQLAQKADVSRQTLSTIRGRKTCTAPVALKLATALNIPAEEIIEKEVQ